MVINSLGGLERNKVRVEYQSRSFSKSCKAFTLASGYKLFCKNKGKYGGFCGKHKFFSKGKFCLAIKANGSQCSRKPKFGKYCSIHKNSQCVLKEYCKAYTVRGTRCTNKAKVGNYCVKHKYFDIKKVNIVSSCKAIKYCGNPCTNKVKQGNYCGIHRNYDCNVGNLDNSKISSSSISVLIYPGGKTKLVDIVKTYIPKGTKIICSPFFGGGSLEIFCNRSYGMEVKGYDYYWPLVNFW
jgi:hypothetical protein